MPLLETTNAGEARASVTPSFQVLSTNGFTEIFELKQKIVLVEMNEPQQLQGYRILPL
jgi:hypothetical protein